MKKQKLHTFIKLAIITYWVILSIPVSAQQTEATHTRGKLWETLINWGFIGNPGVWDYSESTGIGFYPGFSGYYFPNKETDGNQTYKITDANFHNFRSGPWIIAKGAQKRFAPDYHIEPVDFLMYQASLAVADGQNGVLPTNAPFQTTNNFAGNTDFNPLLPEEINYCSFPTNTGVTVSQRSMAWSYPGYNDFIIYDYVFKNTGDQAYSAINKVIPLEQTLNEVWIVFHSGISVSTKGTLNLYFEPGQFTNSSAAAGGFGGYNKPIGHDYYALENKDTDGKGLAFYSYNFNGGRAPIDGLWPAKPNWENLLRINNEPLPELQDPACFGFQFVYRTPPKNGNPDPFEADPTYFRVHSNDGDNFKGKSLRFNESFGFAAFSPSDLYQFATSNFLHSNNGKMYCWYTGSYGPYTLAPGDSIRLIIAEIAGVMDLKEVMRGDPNHQFPDSSKAAIKRTIAAVRRAVSWGIGAKVNGINLAADVPDAPPPPKCIAATASFGSDTAIISIKWDKVAETTKYTDGSGNVFYNGQTDLSGYRIYRSIDKRGIWDLVKDIPVSELKSYWREDLNSYEYKDKDLQFGQEFYYYVQAYNSKPNVWTSANGTVVKNLPELKSGDVNRSELVNVRPGPVSLDNGWDVFVAPNPYIEGDPTHSFGEPNPRKIEFRNLPKSAIIKIFSVSGDIVKTLRHEPDSNGNMFGSISWDQLSDSGLLVAPGLYFYVVQSETDGTIGSRTTGKFMIIR